MPITQEPLSVTYFDEVPPCTSPFGQLSLSIFVPDKNVTWVVHLLMRGRCKTIRYKKSPSDWMGLFYIKAWQ